MKQPPRRRRYRGSYLPIGVLLEDREELAGMTPQEIRRYMGRE